MEEEGEGRKGKVVNDVRGQTVSDAEVLVETSWLCSIKGITEGRRRRRRRRRRADESKNGRGGMGGDPKAMLSCVLKSRKRGGKEVRGSEGTKNHSNLLCSYQNLDQKRRRKERRRRRVRQLNNKT